MSTTAGSYALITGASSGIGAMYAERLAGRGYDLILVTRRAQRLDALARKISSETGREVITLSADLANPIALKQVEDVLRTDGRISLLVNSAGTAAITPLLDSDVEKMSEMIAININALTRLTYAAVPSFISRGGCTIVNIASAVAITSEQLNGVYAASKSYVLAFSQSLRYELADKAVRIQVVLPGVTATDIWANSGLPVENLPGNMVMSVHSLVDAALVGLDRGEFMTAPSLPDLADWDAFERARNALGQNLSRSEPAARYR